MYMYLVFNESWVKLNWKLRQLNYVDIFQVDTANHMAWNDDVVVDCIVY